MRFRAPALDDAPAVVSVLAARDVADLGTVDHTVEELREEWGLSEFDLDHDAQVVETADGRIVAYAAVRRHGTFAAVDPSYEGRGIGTALLEWAEGRERAQARALHRQWVAASNAAARALLTSSGYQHARSYFRMVRSLSDADDEPVPPSGVRLRPVDAARDAVALHAIDHASFSTSSDYVPASLEEFTEEALEANDFDAGLSRVATYQDEIVGFLIARRLEDDAVAFVDVLAVAPAHQGRGVGTALLRSAFAAFAAAGLRQAQLAVSSENAHGLHVYERAGMTARHRFDIYERRAGAEPRQ